MSNLINPVFSFFVNRPSIVYILLLLYILIILKRQLLLNTTFFERYVSTGISIRSTLMYKL
jgi:hypothetical protein